MKLKQKINHESNKPVPRCWTTDCNYTVAMCGVGENAMYIISAPMGRAPFAYTPAKNEVKKIIMNHKELNK